MSKLDELQQEAEKLVSLLKDREVGLASWHGMLDARMVALRDLYFDRPAEKRRRADDNDPSPYDAGQRHRVNRG